MIAQHLGSMLSISMLYPDGLPLRAWHVSLQAFLDSAGEEGVLYVAMGTLATLGVAAP